MSAIQEYKQNAFQGRVRLEDCTDCGSIKVDADAKMFSDSGPIKAAFRICSNVFFDIVVIMTDCVGNVSMDFEIEKQGRLKCVILTESCAKLNATLSITLSGEGASSEIKSFFGGKGSEQQILSVKHAHISENTTSNVVSATVLDDQATSKFYGSVDISDRAEGSDAKQLNNNLIFSEDAKACSYPFLNILNNNVKCSHGATMGTIDEGTLFYMMSRGIDLQSCKSLIRDGMIRSILI